MKNFKYSIQMQSLQKVLRLGVAIGLFLLFMPLSAQRRAITKYFLQSFQGKETLFPMSKPLKADQLETARQEVWDCWLKANAQDSPQLIPLTTLSEQTHGQWVIPETLEPNAKLNYYYGRKGASTDAQIPAFIYLHGSGPRDAEWATGLKLAQVFADAPSIYFIPQIPQEGEWYRWYQRSKQWFMERLLRQLFLHPQVDANRLYLMGISEGGYGSQRLASFYADYWAAVGPMAGGEPLKNAPVENLRNTPFSLRTGAQDFGFYRNLLTRYTREALDSLGRLNGGEYHHWIELIPNAGHAIDYRRTPTWLKQWRRIPTPSRISWEDFEMDGRHRRGFANLQIIQRPNATERTRYEERIEGNVVDLTIQNVHYQALEKDSRWGIELKSARTYTPASGGRLIVYLTAAQVDSTRPVVVRVNGATVWTGLCEPTMSAMINSLACFYDAERIYPFAVEVKY